MESGRGRVPVLVITGPVGVGKTATARAISDLLHEAGMAHALVDMDCLRECHPSPPGDPWQVALGLRNLAAVWANYRDGGVERLILADVVETREMVARFQAAVPGAEIVVVRLEASLPTLIRRLESRESGESLDWHRERAGELAAQMEESRLEDLLVNTEGKTVTEVVLEVLARVGWLSGPLAAPQA